jgi:hypothetical protein
VGIEPFDGGFKASLPWSCKDRHDLEGQTQADDTPHGIGVLIGASRARIILNLGQFRQALDVPLLHPDIEDPLGVTEVIG